MAELESLARAEIVDGEASESDDDESYEDSDTESVGLADPADPATELLSASESYALLKSKIVGKYPKVKTESKVVERSSFQTAFEKEKPKSSSLCMISSVKLRLSPIDEELAVKRPLLAQSRCFLSIGKTVILNTT